MTRGHVIDRMRDHDFSIISIFIFEKPASNPMPSDRRVRFAEDNHKSSERRAAPRPFQTSQSALQSQPPVIVDSQLGEESDFDTSSRAEQILNIHLAHQRGHDAMMLARSMQTDIRSNNERLQRFGTDVKNESWPKSRSLESDTKLIRSTEKHTDPKRYYFDFLKDNDIMSVPVAWITDIFHLSK